MRRRVEALGLGRQLPLRGKGCRSCVRGSGEGWADGWMGVAWGSADGREGLFRHRVEGCWPGGCRWLVLYPESEGKQSP